jgi:hypothetical protein
MVLPAAILARSSHAAAGKTTPRNKTNHRVAPVIGLSTMPAKHTRMPA